MTTTENTTETNTDLPTDGALTAICGAHCGTDSRGTAHCPRCHAGDCAAASDVARAAAAIEVPPPTPADHLEAFGARRPNVDHDDTTHDDTAHDDSTEEER